MSKIDPLGLSENDLLTGGISENDIDSNGNLTPTQGEVEGRAILDAYGAALRSAGKIELAIVSIEAGGTGAISASRAYATATTVGERVWSAGTGFAGLFAAGQGVAYLTGNELPKAITQPASYVTTTLDLFNRDWNGLILDAVSWASDNFYEGDGTMIAPINSLGPNLNLIVPPPPVLLPNFGSQQNTKCP